MSFITDTFFGGAEKKAAKAQQAGIERGIQATQAATRRAESQALPLFGQAREDIQQGFQGALDVFGNIVPQQSDFFQRGNIGAQQAILAGLPQQQAAILGGQIDLSALQPSQQFQPDFSFLNQNIMPAPPPIQENVAPPDSGLAGGSGLSLNEILGAFGAGPQNALGGFNNTLSTGGLQAALSGGGNRNNNRIFDFRN